jgi:hypothetical protein
MPLLTGPLTGDGSVIDVLVALTPADAGNLRRAGQAVPAPLTLRALLDPGASDSCIDVQCVQALALAAKGTRTFHTPSLTGPQTLTQYEISLTILHPQASYTFYSLPVAAAVLSPQGIEALLGRNVLKQCLFVYDGHGGTWSLGF